MPFLIPFIVIGVLFIGSFCFIAYGVVAAVMALQGRPFRYAIIGRRVERFMSPEGNRGNESSAYVEGKSGLQPDR